MKKVIQDRYVLRRHFKNIQKVNDKIQASIFVLKMSFKIPLKVI